MTTATSTSRFFTSLTVSLLPQRLLVALVTITRMVFDWCTHMQYCHDSVNDYHHNNIEGCDSDNVTREGEEVQWEVVLVCLHQWKVAVPSDIESGFVDPSGRKRWSLYPFMVTLLLASYGEPWVCMLPWLLAQALVESTNTTLRKASYSE